MRNLIIILLLSLVSCGTRNVSKTETKTEIAAKDTTEVVINSGATTKVEEKTTKKESENTNWDFESGTMTPVDPDKPMTYTDSDGKTTSWTNTKVDFGTGSGNSTKHTETTKEAKTESKDTSVTKVNTGSGTEIKKSTKTKKTDRKGTGNSIGFWIGIAFATCIVLWFLWFVIIRKRKTE